MNAMNLSPLFRTAIGFDRLARMVDTAAAADTSYPPYNIEKTGEESYRLTMAVAGFGPEDIELTLKENTLLVAGRVAQEAPQAELLYRGIAGRAFERRFVLADHIVVDGAEGGTGAAPVEFTDHVGAPLQEGLLLVHNTLVGLNLRERIKLGCAGKVITAFDIARMLALGADWCNSARGFMFALGCIQAQTCHTGNCPTGVTTQDALRGSALDVPSKVDRVYHFHQNTLMALKELVQAAGLTDPSQITASHIVRRTEEHSAKLLVNMLPFVQPGELLRGDMTQQVFRMYWPMAQASSFAVRAT